MGKVEIIIIAAVIILIAVVVWLYVKNSDKIKADKQKQVDEEKKAAEAKKTEELAAKKAANGDAKAVMEQVSNQAEDYIKSLMLKDEQKQKHNDIVFEETTEDFTRDPAEDEAAIILGIKKQSVHVIDENEEDDMLGSYRENSVSILNDMDNNSESAIKSKQTNISIEDFQEDESVGEEFRTMSKEMKIVMLANVLGKKENQDK